MKESDAYHIDPRAVDALAAELAKLRAELRQARDDNTMLRDRLHQLANDVMAARAERDKALAHLRVAEEEEEKP